MLFLCGIINYLDRSALSISAPHIEKEFTLSAGELGIIFSAFSVGYACFNFIGGIAADKFGPKDTLLVALIIWSLFSGAVAFTVGFVSLLIIRVIFGMAEGPLSTTVNKTVDLWYPPDRKTSVVSLADSATPLGAAISGPIVGYISIHYNWRISFIVIMLIGLIWSFFWWRHVDKKPQQDVNESESKNSPSEANQDSRVRISQKLKLSFYLKKKTVIFVTIAYFAYNYILFFFLTWLPSYLTTARHMSMGLVSLVNVIPWTLGFFGMAFGGYLSDIITRKVKNEKHMMLPKSYMIGIGLLFSGLAIFLVNYVHSNILIVAFITIAVFFMYLTGGIYWGVLDESVDHESVGAVGGFMHSMANMAGIIGPTLTGFIVQYTGNFFGAFAFAGVLGLIGGIGALLFIRDIKVTKDDLKKYAVTK